MYTICISDSAFDAPVEMTPSIVAAVIEEEVVRLLHEADDHAEVGARHISRANSLRRQAAFLSQKARGLRLQAAQERFAKQSMWVI
jgi:hypothetical protein